LIELLVVIAIIALLAAILFPVFARAREQARKTSCLNNEKQVGLAFLQYSQDFDEMMPWGNSVSPGRGWAGPVYPYLKDKNVLRCPNDTTQPAAGVMNISYGYNMNIRQGVGSAIASMTTPTKTVLLFEVANLRVDAGNPAEVDSVAANGGDGGGAGYIDYSGGGAFYTTGLMGIPVRSTASYRMYNPRHLDGSNFIMADGHAKWLSPQKVSPGYSNNNAACKQDQVNNPCVAANGYSAGTGDSTFLATFSPT
jgi:prepilin-type processing-associated H-X9-DG protein